MGSLQQHKTKSKYIHFFCNKYKNIFLDNSWRIGPDPDTNAAGIAAYDNTYGDSPQKITEWSYSDGSDWVYSSCIAVEIYNGDTRLLKHSRGLNNTTNAKDFTSGVINPADKNKIEKDEQEKR